MKLTNSIFAINYVDRNHLQKENPNYENPPGSLRHGRHALRPALPHLGRKCKRNPGAAAKRRRVCDLQRQSILRRPPHRKRSGHPLQLYLSERGHDLHGGRKSPHLHSPHPRKSGGYRPDSDGRRNLHGHHDLQRGLLHLPPRGTASANLPVL